jgi:predicted MFS family arabinose efflux permease
MVAEHDDLANAIALNSLLVNGARLVGPVLAGCLVVAAGEAVCFLLNGCSFAAVIVALLRMRFPARATGPRTSLRHQLRAGLRYAWGALPIRAVLLLLALVSLLGVSYVVLLPVLARDLLRGDARTLGILTAATGAGAITGGLYLAWRRGTGGLLTVVGEAAAVLGAALMLLGWLTSLPGILLALMVVGAGVVLCTAGSNTLLQTLVAEEARGRVMGLYSTAFSGMIPPGALLAGQLTATAGATRTLLLCGGSR